MLKSDEKHVCRHLCAKSVRSILEPYSQYLISQGYSTHGIGPTSVLWSISGGGWEGNTLAGLLFSNSSNEGCWPANVQE